MDNFELAPKQLSTSKAQGGASQAYSYANDPITGFIFRMIGSSIFNTITTGGDAHFENLFIGNGYNVNSVAETELQVDGTITIEELAGTGEDYLCVNDFGVLQRCPDNLFSANSGVCKTHPANTEQLATDNASGCDVGYFFDKYDTTTDFLWGCRISQASLVASPVEPGDVNCSHPIGTQQSSNK